jgi:hypothetical protein
MTQDETVPLFVITNASDVITGCYSQTSPAQMCIDMGGTYNPTGTPKCTLSTASVCVDMGGVYDVNATPKCQIPGPDTKVGTPTVEGWGKFNPFAADAGGWYTQYFEGVCPKGYRAMNCLACEGSGCTPYVTLMDHVQGPGGYGVSPTQTANPDTKLYLRWILAITSNPTGPSDPTIATCALQMQWTIYPALPYNGTTGSGHWPYGPGTQGYDGYQYQTGNYRFMRTAPLCQKM